MELTPAETCRPDDVEALVRAARAFAAITAESIARAEGTVTLPQLRVLILAENAGPLNNNTVAKALDVHISNASRLCDRLVQAGLLDRRESRTDRRNVELTLTGAGLALVSSVTLHRRDVFTRVLSLLAPAERVRVAEAMTVFAEATESLDGLTQFAP